MFHSTVTPEPVSQEAHDSVMDNLEMSSTMPQPSQYQRFSTANCPQGFEFLVDAKDVIVQDVTICLGYRGYRFDILNSNGQIVMETAPGGLCDFGFVTRAPRIGAEYLYTKRKLLGMYAACCDEGLRVEAPRGNLLGFVTVRLDKTCCTSCCDHWCKCFKNCNCSNCKCRECCAECACCGIVSKPRFCIMDPSRKVVMTINEQLRKLCPACPEGIQELPFVGDFIEAVETWMNCKDSCEDTVYTLRANDDDIIGSGTVIGEIRRKFVRCFCPGPPRYVVAFPDNLDIRMKVVVMSAVFLMRYLGY